MENTITTPPADIKVILKIPNPWARSAQLVLSNRWWIIQQHYQDQRIDGYKYSLWEPGGDQAGSGGYRGGANRLKDVLTLAATLQRERASAARGTD